MQLFIPLIYDGVVVAVFLYMISSCARRGFAYAVVSLVGFAGALACGLLCAKPLAQMIFTAVLRVPVARSIAEKLSVAQEGLFPNGLLELIEGLPETLLEAVGLKKETLNHMLGELMLSGEDVATGITDTIVAPLVILLLRSIIFLLVFSVALFLVGRLARLFGDVNNLPLIGPVNRLLGAVVGAAQAALTLYMIAIVLRTLISFTGGTLMLPLQDQSLILAGDSVFNSTFLFKFFIHTNPLDLFLLAQQPAPSLPSNGARFI